MSPSPIPGFLTKKEVEERYGRSHRSLTRDFSSAVRVGDTKVLKHLKIRTDDGENHRSESMTLERIQELSNRGLTPTWFIEQTWAEERYGKRSKETKTSKQTTPKSNQRVGSDEPIATSDQNELVARLEEQITELKQDKDELRKEMTIKNDQIKQPNERTRESNVLMTDLQKMLGDWQQRAIKFLPQPKSRPVVGSAVENAVVVAASETLGTTAKQPSDDKQKRTPRAATQKVPANKGSHPIRKSTPHSKRPSASTAQRKTPAKKQPVGKISEKPKRYETPTLKRFLSRTR